MPHSGRARLSRLSDHLLPASELPQRLAPRASGGSPGDGGSSHRAIDGRIRFRKVLIANRSVAAIRIARAAEELGLETVAVFDPDEDAAALHHRLCREAIALPRSDGRMPYLDAEALVTAAKQTGADCVHPGYGFLAESAEFARRCSDAGLVFVGPRPQALDIFGDKTKARALAASLRPAVPTLTGSDVAFETAEHAYAFVESQGMSGRALMLKAAHGGGGRGLRRIPSEASKEGFLAAFQHASAEAKNAFGVGGLYVEELLERCRHIEVQIVASERNEVAHLYERDCSVQLARGAKVVEVCPAADLPKALREHILKDAVRLLAATPGGYSNVGTVEFLVELGVAAERQRHFFIEVNPRLQVEHGITEEACGVDLVRSQFLLAQGWGLHHSLGLASEHTWPSEHGIVPEPESFAVQARVCMTAPPQSPVTDYREPGGRGVRVESALQVGVQPSGRYDPMLALVIGTDKTLAAALARVGRCVDDFDVGGVTTNLELLREIVRSQEVHTGSALTVTTSWTPAPNALPIRMVKPLNPIGSPQGVMQDGHHPGEVRSPVAGLLRWEVTDGQVVREGAVIAIVLAMKMENPLKAPSHGKIIFSARDSAEVAAGELIAALEIVAFSVAQEEERDPGGRDVQAASRWADIVNERRRRGELALQLGGQEALAERHRGGHLTIRQRVLAVLDDDSFREVGPVAGTFRGDRASPANFILGTGRISGRPVVIGGEDFTIAGGSPNSAGFRKSVFTEKFALQLRIPLVRLHEGGGGAVKGSGGGEAGGRGGRAGAADRKEGQAKGPASAGGADEDARGGGDGDFRYASLAPSPVSGAPIVESTRFGTVAGCLGVIPVVSAALGTVAGMAASRLVGSHFVVALRSAEILVAGPRVVEYAVGRRLTKGQLGGEVIHSSSGVVDNYVSTEEEAFLQIRQFLSFLPSNVDALPPVVETLDPADRREEELLRTVPEDRAPYDMRRLIKLVVDRDWPSIEDPTHDSSTSFFEIGTCEFGKEMITGLARIRGQPVGVFGNDPRHLSGAMTWQAALKTRRFIDFCVTFHLPIVTFVDQPGFMVGPDAEQAGTIRFGTAAVLAAQTAQVPWCTVVVRRRYGVAAGAHFGPDAYVLLWPSAEQGTLPVEAGVAVKYRRQLEAALPGERRKLAEQLAKEHRKATNPWPFVESGEAQDLIDPRDTRPQLCEWIELAGLQLPAFASRASFPYRP